MSLAPHTRFGNYEVVAPLGAGGMGEVYLATDLRLERKVAIKTLPATLAADADRLARFDREAKMLAALSHPNIAHVYGFEHSGGIHAFVMELVEGPTLADRLLEGPLPAEEALHAALQIAAALEAAHEQGIVHRDLKPANIKLKPDGTVKVLDFGIAKSLFMPRAASGQPAPLATPALTEIGIVLGTAAYMSPEQARGKHVDERADIWAFGCVLYEMLTARRAFEGDDVATTLARVVEREADIAALPDSVSPAVRHAIALCLQKDLGKRLADIRDVRLALQGSLSVAGPSAAASPRSLWRRAWPAAAGFVVGAAASAIAWNSVSPPPSEPGPVARFSIPVQSFLPLIRPWLSGDGSIVGFVAGDPPQIHVRRTSELDIRLVPNSPRTAGCFSPDGSWLAYVDPASQRLHKARLSGDGALVLAQGVQPGNCDWADDGNIYVVVPDGLARVPEQGGAPEVIARRPSAEVSYGLPQLLPGGRKLLAVVVDQSGRHAAIVDVATGEVKRVVTNATDATYIPGSPGASTGHLVAMTPSGLVAARMDVNRAEVQAPIPVPDLPATTFPAHVSASGTLVYVDAVPTVETRLTWVGRDGSETPLLEPPRVYATGSLSTDGKYAATAIGPGGSLDVWSYDVEANLPTRLTFGGVNSPGPFTPDGRDVLYVTSPTVQNITREIRSIARDGSGPPVTLGTFESTPGPQAWGPTSLSFDGKTLLGSGYRTAFNSDIWILRLDDASLDGTGGRRATPLLATDYMERQAAFSPDARFIAYASNETGREEVYVVPYPLTGAKWQISADGGAWPQWSASGAELFYLAGTTMMAVPIDATTGFRFGRASTLFDAAAFADSRPFGVAPDSTRFLMQKRVSAGATAVHVVVNWAEELRRLLPLSAN